MPSLRNKKILVAFGLPLVFWIYLAFSSTMTIAFDSIAFESFGKILESEGLRGYLKSPQKEPLYACTVSFSMRLADGLHLDYKKIQTGFQILLLFLGQIFLYRVLLCLKLRETVTAIALLYYGFSPALIGCGFSLYSEIVTLPFVLMSVLYAHKSWHSLLAGERKSTTTSALLFTLFATIATFSKAMLIIVYPLFILPFIIIPFVSFAKSKKGHWQCATIFLIIFLATFNASISGYKSLNKKYHGIYTFTDDRGSPMFYTLAFKRTAPLTKELLGIALTSIPGQNICRAFYGQACYDWLFDGSASLGIQKSNEFATSGIPKEKIQKTLVLSAFKQVVSNPLQYSFFAFLEALKMFFWETTQGFVSYPSWMAQVYNNAIFKNSLRLLVSLMTLLSTVYAMTYLFKNHRWLYAVSGKDALRYQCLFFLVSFLTLFISFYALVMTATRYSLPIAPVFIILMAFAADELMRPRHPRG